MLRLHASFAHLAIGLLLLTGCPPPAKEVCAKLYAKQPPPAPPEAAFKSECDGHLRGMSSGEYGACAQCVVDGVTPMRLAECRPLCRGMEKMIPPAPAAAPDAATPTTSP